MATYQLGPESPRPFAVLSEGHLDKEVTLPSYEEKERFSFGGSYERSLCEMIHKYLELGTDDRLCYVGEQKGSVVELLTREFCLLKPAVSLQPGLLHYQETSEGNRMVPIRLPHMGAQEYFAEVRRGEFDKVLLYDCVHFFTDHKQLYLNIMRSLSNTGRLLIILRPSAINTLPLFRDAVSRQEAMSQDYMTIIHDLQNLYFDVQWEIECLPVVMPKVKWFTMMRDKYPPSLEAVSNQEVMRGIRELSEGMLKYGDDLIEFKDRLLFITASHNSLSEYPSVQRHSATALRPYPGVEDLRYSLEITPDIKRYLSMPQQVGRRSAKKPAPDAARKPAVHILP